MGVGVSRDGYYGDFGSFSCEQKAYERWQDENRDPEVIPCLKCQNPMYDVKLKPICDDCESAPKGAKGEE